MSRRKRSYSLYADPAVQSARDSQSAAYKDGFRKGRAEGYRAGLEAAAVECESQSAPVPKMSGATEYGNPAALRCARAIRALAKEA